MRPGQQNKRSRGRSNGSGGGGSNGNNNNFNRKGGNPLTRSYDSSGPDVKIRGTAQHIAEKYMTLARDAQSSGDRVMAENYLQHAEHYNRIIASAQAQMQERVHRDDRDYNEREHVDTEAEVDNDVDGDDQDVVMDRSAHHAQEAQPRSSRPQQHQRPQHQQRSQHQPRPQQHVQPQPLTEVEIAGSGPQPIIENTPVEAAVAAEEVAQQAEAGKKERVARPRRAAAARPRRPRRTEGDGAAEGGEGAPAGDAPAALETASSE